LFILNAMPQPIWQTTRFKLDLSQPKVMAIVNLTPDSFSDGGRHSALSSALDWLKALIFWTLVASHRVQGQRQ